MVGQFEVEVLCEVAPDAAPSERATAVVNAAIAKGFSEVDAATYPDLARAVDAFLRKRLTKQQVIGWAKSGQYVILTDTAPLAGDVMYDEPELTGAILDDLIGECTGWGNKCTAHDGTFEGRFCEVYSDAMTRIENMALAVAGRKVREDRRARLTALLRGDLM